MNLYVIGTGYVGLVTAACFAKKGHTVTCIDTDVNKIAVLQKGIVPFYEKGLPELVQEGIARNTLFFSSHYPNSLPKNTLVFLALPTPSCQDGSCNLAYVRQALSSLLPAVKDKIILINKSTVPMGTVRQIEEWTHENLQKEERSIAVSVVSNPEFLKEGSAVSDCLYPDRVIIGTRCSEAKSAMQELYSSFVPSEKLLFMSPESAELTKYASNAMLALRISFMNEMASLCEKTKASIHEVKQGIGSDTRIGNSFLNAGIGYGGSCFPKDIRALIELTKEHASPSLLLRAIEETNERQKRILFAKICSHFSSQGGVAGKKIAVWGLAFKPGTDDIREAPSLSLISSLLEEGAFVSAFDPVAMENVRRTFPPHPNLSFANDPYEAALQADAIALVTEWDQFAKIDFNKLLSLVTQPFLFDGRNLYSSLALASLGFIHIGIGLPQVIHDAASSFSCLR